MIYIFLLIINKTNAKLAKYSILINFIQILDDKCQSERRFAKTTAQHIETSPEMNGATYCIWSIKVIWRWSARFITFISDRTAYSTD